MDKIDITPDRSIGAPQETDHIGASAELISDTRPAVATITAKAETNVEVATSAENPVLATYRQEYDRMSDNVKNRCPWETVAARLLANNFEKLKIA